MKLTLSNRLLGKNVKGVVADQVAPAACPLHLNHDGTLALAIPAHNGNHYTFSADREEWQNLFFRIEDIYDSAAAYAIEGAHGASGLCADPFAADAADPTPQLTAEVKADMEASALDCFRRRHTCLPDHLTRCYGMLPHHVVLYGQRAIASARAQWEKEGGRAA